jgi:predicted metalloenzyme YecM
MPKSCYLSPKEYIIFITQNIADFKKLTEYANKVDAITQTLNHLLNDMNLDCQSCNLKPICDKVEGMRELYFKTIKSSKGKSF